MNWMHLDALSSLSLFCPICINFYQFVISVLLCARPTKDTSSRWITPKSRSSGQRRKRRPSMTQHSLEEVTKNNSKWNTTNSKTIKNRSFRTFSSPRTCIIVQRPLDPDRGEGSDQFLLWTIRYSCELEVANLQFNISICHKLSNIFLHLRMSPRLPCVAQIRGWVMDLTPWDWREQGQHEVSVNGKSFLYRRNSYDTYDSGYLL